jgi:hypothetical protein
LFYILNKGVQRKVSVGIRKINSTNNMSIIQLKRKQRVIDGQVMTVTAQSRKCGKSHCRCQRPGQRKHGPYWYGYWRENGKLRSRYIGRELPSEEQLPSAG